MIHMLKSAGASEKAIQIAKELKCSVCESRKPPESHHVTKSRRPAENFNEHVNMDTFELPIYQNKKLNMLNIYDGGTGLLWRGRTVENVRKAYRMP